MRNGLVCADLYRKRGKKIEAALQILFAKQYRSTFQTDITIEIDTKIFLFSLTNNWICFHIQIYEPLTVELITRRDVGGISDEKTIFQIGDNLSSGSGTRQGRIARGTGVNKPRTICQRNEWKEERNWHFWPSHWWMLRASFLLVSFRVIDIPSLPLEEVASYHRMNRWIMPLLALYSGICIEGDGSWRRDDVKKIFQRFSSASDFSIRIEGKNYLRILGGVSFFFFFFFLVFLFIIVEQNILAKGFGHVADFIAAERVTNWNRCSHCVRFYYIFIVRF